MRHALLLAAIVVIAACSSTEAAPVANTATVTQDGHASHSAASNGELTAEQKQSVRAVFENNAPQRKALHARQRSNREALASTMPDDPGYPALIAAKKQLAAEAIQQASDTQTQVFALLTAEQKAKIPQILAERKARWEQRRAERQAQRPVASL